MRQFLWKGRLIDNDELINYKNNMEGPSSILFKNSPDEPLILHDIQRIFSQQEWTGNLHNIIKENERDQLYAQGNRALQKLDPIQLFLQIVVYTHTVLGSKTLFKESLMNLLVPIIYVFRNYQIEYRQQYLTVMYLTLIKRLHVPIVKYKYAEGDPETEFARDFRELRDSYLRGIKILDADFEQYLRSEIFKEDEEPSAR